MKRATWTAAVLLLAACSLSTSRPSFPPMPEARVGDLDVEVAEATERIARALADAGIPVGRVSPQDGYLETPWFDAATGRPAGGRPLGLDRVRVRGWVTPSAHGSSEIKVEAVYRPVADPSRPARELERSVPYAHPVREQVRTAFRAIGARVSLEEPDAITLSARRAAARRPERDTTRADSIAADSVPADSVAPARPVAAMDSLRALPAPSDTTSPAPRVTPPVQPAAPPRDTARVAARPPAARDSVRAPLAAPAQAQVPAPAQAQAPRDTARAPVRTPAAAPVPAARDTAPAAQGFSVQVAATSDSLAASLAARRLGAMGIEPNVIREGGLLKVRSGVYPTRQAAQTVLGRIRRSFPDAFVVR